MVPRLTSMSFRPSSSCRPNPAEPDLSALPFSKVSVQIVLEGLLFGHCCSIGAILP
jgi:hypothetical protein